MDKNNFKSCLSSFERLDNGISYGEKGSVCIDQTPCARANINPRTGFPYTDMQKIMLQQDLVERRRLLENMQSYRDDFLPADIKEEEAFKYMSGSNMQLPSEFTEEVERVTSDWLKKELSKAESSKKIDFWNSVINGDVKPSKHE